MKFILKKNPLFEVALLWFLTHTCYLRYLDLYFFFSQITIPLQTKFPKWDMEMNNIFEKIPNGPTCPSN